jgi:phenylalanyl-tRNA synthetase beta subunit
VAPRGLIGQVQDQLQTFGGAELLAIEFLRDYALETGDRSVSFRLTVGAPDRTLSMDEVNAMRSRMIEGMRGLGYELRV